MAKQKFVSFANLFPVSKALRERAEAEAAITRTVKAMNGAYDSAIGRAVDAERKTAVNIISKRMMAAYNYATGRV